MVNDAVLAEGFLGVGNELEVPDVYVTEGKGECLLEGLLALRAVEERLSEMMT